MEDAQAQTTSPTLLGRLCLDPPDATAWAAFVYRYGPRIHAWCQQQHLQEADAQDVTQDVLLKLLARMRTFSYDESRSFRGWLKTVTMHALCDHVEEQRLAGRGSGGFAAIENVEAREDFVRYLDHEFDLELLEEAKTRVRRRVQTHTWEVFRLLTEDRVTGDEVGQRLSMEVATVFATRSKVKKMLREEIHRLECRS